MTLLHRVALFFSLTIWFGGSIGAADLAEAEQLFRAGHYDECARLSVQEIERGAFGETWHELRIKSHLARGQDQEAIAAFEEVVRRFPVSIPVHLLGWRVYQQVGRDKDAAQELDTIETTVFRAPQRFTSPENRIALGRFFLLRGADARKVLDQFYDVATTQKPAFAEGYLATAELALEKEDDALAASTLQKAPKSASEDPHYHYLTARAFENSDRARASAALDEALKINPRHVESLLLKVDDMIDAEKYTEAEQAILQIFDVNPVEPKAWAYKAILAHLRTDNTGEIAARNSALRRWATNPDVDHLIGKKLSQKYRFTEGARYQKQALAFDPGYQPAKVQLCQDLLRLGDETEGWKLADEIFTKDAYNVVAYNLVTLRDRLAGFRTLKADGFLIRMENREADLYGERVVALLERARRTLTEKYGIKVQDSIVVEIFPQKKEFAVRTFGLPGADGLLGVCFGRVITANSPASQGANPANWESVLWHEFCHVATLHKTNNKMPRWLSEGISVYEETQQDPAWGSPLNPHFRKMILGEELTPLSKLSSAFLAPKSGLHLQFAYFESSLAVEYLVHKFGFLTLKRLLDDLGAGISLNVALPDRSKMSLEQLDAEFSRFARARASSIAPDVTWEDAEFAPNAESKEIALWLVKHPTSFNGLKQLATRLVSEGKLPEAKTVLEKLIRLYPEYVGPDNAYLVLASVYKRLKTADAEYATLEELARRDSNANDAYTRLMEMDEAAKNWKSLAKNARRLLAVNPLIPLPHRALARAAENLGERDEAIRAYRALALVDESDPADLHYHLAKLLSESGKKDEAKREVLKSLEEAPRYLESHQLLLQLIDQNQVRTSRPAASQPRGR